MASKKLGQDTYRLILIDAMNLCARHDWRSLEHNGMATGMFFGVLQTTLLLMQTYSKAKIAFLWEGNGSWRKRQSPFYKSSRKKRQSTQDHADFVDRARIVREFVLCMGVVNVHLPEWEADDLAAYFSAYTDDRPVLLVSQDHDWFALLAQDVHIRYGNTILIKEQAAEKLGYPVERSTLWKQLKGCSSDAIPGIFRFPTKLAMEAVQTCATYSEVVAFLKDKGQHKWVRKVETHNFEEVESLVSLDPSRVPEDEIVVDRGELDIPCLRRVCEKYGFVSLVGLVDLLKAGE